ncbi:MAG: hypothetical protein RBR22_00915 [Desulfuromonas sp.]|nr:hypothetical protein [Desulfuromonas sp.]
MKLSCSLFSLLLLGYLVIFSSAQQRVKLVEATLSPPLPAVVQRLLTGNLKELAAELLFVKTAVFYGGNVSYERLVKNADSFSLNLDVASAVYPQFIDPYYLCQAALPSISPEYAAIANTILARSVNANPDDLFIPFFRGFNFFYYMDKPHQAAQVFAELAKHDSAPNWFGHLGAILSARGGNLYAGLISLQSMLAVETDQHQRDRYSRDIETFQQAIAVQKATQQYFATYANYPATLTDLVPEFLPQLPTFTDFTLQWQPPDLKLVRPQR